jgi:hypothetical protein
MKRTHGDEQYTSLFVDWRIGATLGRAFLGRENGTDLVVVVAKEGPYQGQVISSFVPDANQLSLILAR